MTSMLKISNKFAPWELHVNFSLMEKSKFINKINGLAETDLIRVKLNKTNREHVYVYSSKESASEARKRIKTLIRDKVNCEIVPA